MRLEQKATVISTSTAAILVTLKMIIGVMSGSVAILASAIDSFLDLAVSLFNYYALRTSHKEADEQFNYGRSKVEPLAAVIEGTIISLSGLFVFYEALQKLFHHRPLEYINESIYVMLISIVLTGALVLYLSKVAKATNSMVIKADALHYRTDLFSNGAVLLALIFMMFFKNDIIDPILGILIAIYMIYSAFPIVKEGILMLLDVAIEPEDLALIKRIFDRSLDINGYHHLRTRMSASEYFISVHVVFDTEISLNDAHKISDNFEDEIKNLFPEKEVYSIIHMDPYDDSDVY